jgi:hypothetical protein
MNSKLYSGKANQEFRHRDFTDTDFETSSPVRYMVGIGGKADSVWLVDLHSRGVVFPLHAHASGKTLTI